MVQKLSLALLCGKVIFFLTRLIKIGGGSAAPGLYALKIDPELISNLTDQVPNRVVITGTNGKTTTARLLKHFAQHNNLKVINNKTGSNLERGVASALIENISLKSIFLGRPRVDFDLSIWETDEAAFNSIVPKVKPTQIIFLNIFRDQMDRYGEIDTTIKKWSDTLSKVSAKTIILINSDDHNLIELTNLSKQNIKTFALAEHKISGEKTIQKLKNKAADFYIKNIIQKGLYGTSFDVFSDGKLYINIFLPIPGIYHLYDFLAAFSIGLNLGFNPEKMIDSLKSFSPAFGRVEKIEDWGYIFLIKNPTGASQVIQTITSELKPEDRLLIALNDNLADGTDVSWIWDVNFELIQNSSHSSLSLRSHPSESKTRAKLRDNMIVASGTRAYDLANRLKYAGIDMKNITIVPEIGQALEQAKQDLKGRLFMLPTYTALLTLEKVLAEQGIKGHYWKEQ